MINPLEALEEDDPSPFEGDSNDESEELQEAFGEMSRETLLAFVGALFFAHVGLLATSVGLLLVAFSGQWMPGGVIAVVGIAALALTGWIYRWYDEAK
ncbi:hypothetical protein [Natronococcus sp. A-GB7]|uniref:DUF7322 domain-containing protein n=1 Tax=Natronococcus sp. A-GB7 TaxID=3037649 RepID=UPI00241FD4B9|nr:hypothetical protein [Natronococcus sp. A-GB7]MDG5819973.1 hypothetical protein [Natronococcus sp. A-GB7]